MRSVYDAQVYEGNQGTAMMNNDHIQYLENMNRENALTRSWHRFAEAASMPFGGYRQERAAGGRMDRSLVQELNARLFFQSGMKKPKTELRPWQYVEMTYRNLGLTPPAEIPPLETMEDADIWMCLDERLNRRMRLREESLAG